MIEAQCAAKPLPAGNQVDLHLGHIAGQEGPPEVGGDGSEAEPSGVAAGAMVAEREVVEGLLRVHVHVDVQVRVGAVHVVGQRQGVTKQFFTLACRAAERLDRAMSEIGIPQRMLGQEAQPGRHLGDAVLAGCGVGAGQRHPDLRAAERATGRAAGDGQRAVHDQVGAA